MKLRTTIFIFSLLLATQSSAFANNKVHDKQLLQAYKQLIIKPAQKAQKNKQAVPKRRHHSTPQLNAVIAAKKQINKKYRWGGANPHTGFDCSGLMQYAYKSSNVHLPRTAAAQYKHTKRVSMKDLKVGDLIFFHTRRTRARVNHVGIYLGGSKFIHAPRRGKRVSIANLNSYWKKKAVGAGRV